MKTALITGATSGIGKATAEALASNYRLILCGRRTDKLNEIKENLSKITDVHILTFDVSNKDQVFNAINNLPAEWKQIDVLINNAGNAHGLASFQEANIEDLEAMIDINVKGLIYVTKAVLPLMLPIGNGHIVNLSSTAGKETYQNGTVYCASKSAVEALSTGMRLDLVTKGIKVTNIAPGAVETDFSLIRFKGDQERAAKVYEGYQPLQALDIANAIHYALMQPEHVQLSDITIYPKAQASPTIFNKKIQ